MASIISWMWTGLKRLLGCKHAKQNCEHNQLAHVSGHFPSLPNTLSGLARCIKGANSRAGQRWQVDSYVLPAVWPHCLQRAHHTAL